MIAPHVADIAPPRTCVLAPEAPTFACLLFRGVRYWDTPYEHWTTSRFDSLASDMALRAFVVDTAAAHYGGWPDTRTLHWLETHTHEVTAEVTARRGRPLEGLRVFIRSAAPVSPDSGLAPRPTAD